MMGFSTLGKSSMRPLVFAISVLAASAPALSARHAALDFTLLNSTGLLILELHVSPNDADDWKDDLLGLEQLKPNEAVRIMSARPEASCAWDLKIKKEDGDLIEWDSLDLCTASHVTLLYSNGTPTVVVR
jgi:hypothetical protein